MRDLQKTCAAGAAFCLPALIFADASGSGSADLWISAGALLLAAAFSWLVYWPQMSAVLVPYFKAGDCDQAGFLPLKLLMAKVPMYRATAFNKFMLPLWATTSLFLVMLLSYLLDPSAFKQTSDLYGFALIWGLGVLASGHLVRSVVFLGIPFAIGWLITRSLYGGYLGSAFVLAILFAASARSNLLMSLLSRKIELETGRTLNGEPLKGLAKLRLRLGFPVWLLELAAIGFTLHSFWENSVWSLPDLMLRYAPAQASGLVGTLVLLILFSNVSFRVFGGIFDHLQLDLFAGLAHLMRTKYEHPEQFAQFDGTLKLDPVGAASNPVPGLLNILPTDRLYELRDVGVFFQNALFFFSLDLLLTASTVLRIPLLPGLNLDQTAMLSAVLKFPAMIVLGVGMLYGLLVYLTASGKMAYPSYSYQQEVASGERYFRETEKFLRRVQEQRLGGLPYLDVHANRFLLGLVGKG